MHDRRQRDGCCANEQLEGEAPAGMWCWRWRSRPSDARPGGSVARFGRAHESNICSIIADPPPGDRRVAHPAYAELHCHSHFSFLDGASAPDDLVARAVELGLAGLGRHRPPGPLRRGPVLDGGGGGRAAPGDRDRDRAARRRRCPTRAGSSCRPGARGGRAAGRRSVAEPPARRRGPCRRAPARPCPAARPSARWSRRTTAAIGERQRGPHLVLLARDATGLAEPVPARVAREPRGDEGRAAVHPRAAGGARGGRRRAVGLPRRRARAAAAGGRSGGRAGAGGAVRGAVRDRASRRRRRGFVLELSHHLLPDDDWLVVGDRAPRRRARAAGRGHQRRPLRPARRAASSTTSWPRSATAGRCASSPTCGGRTASRTSRGRPSCSRCRRASRRPPSVDPVLARALARGDRGVGGDRRGCQVDLAFERYRFPGFPVPKGETPFSHLSELCWEGARRRYHPLTPAVVQQLAHELDVIEQTGLAEFFLICWDLMRFAKARGIPAQGRGSAADSIVAYVLGITPGRPDPPRAAVRAVHQRGPDGVPGRRHRLLLRAAGGGHPVRLRALRRRAHGDGLQPRHVPGAVGGPRGGLRAGVPAAARGPGGQGARDVRLGDGPAGPRGGGRLRRSSSRGRARLGRRPAESRSSPRPRQLAAARGLTRRDGPAESTRAAGASGGSRPGPGAHRRIDQPAAAPARRHAAARRPAADAGKRSARPVTRSGRAGLRRARIGAFATGSAGRPGDDEGGPGDSAVSVRWIQRGGAESRTGALA